MPVLQKKPGVLTFSEISDRLKKNSNDPELKRFRKSFEKLRTHTSLDSIYLPPSPSTQRSQMLEEVRELKRAAQSKPANNAGIDLLPTIPEKKKYRVARKIAKEFRVGSRVNNFVLARCIVPTIRTQSNKRRNLLKADYLSNQKVYNQKIRNRLKYLKNVADKEGYVIKLRFNYTEIMPKSTASKTDSD